MCVQVLQESSGEGNVESWNPKSSLCVHCECCPGAVRGPWVPAVWVGGCFLCFLWICVQVSGFILSKE